MRVGVVILPDLRWPDALARWREAEAIGFSTAWTYDHLSWRTLRDGPWLGAVPLLAGVAAATTTLRLGTLVTSPNFRHPALLAKDVMTLDEISAGRIDLGIGAGGTGFDADVLGEPPLSARERVDRFVEFVDALDVLLREPAASLQGHSYTVVESRTYPGCTQHPRVPFTIAAAGPRALAVAARHGASWVTYGARDPLAEPAEWFDALATQTRSLDAACHNAKRDPATLRREVLIGLDLHFAQRTIAAWDEVVGRLAELGFSDVVVHWPRPKDPDLPGPHPLIFDEICARLAASPGG